MAVTSVKIDDKLEGPLEIMAKKMQRPKGWIINEALREYIAHNATQEQRWQDTLEALEDIRMGRTVDGDKVHAWLKTWGKEDELDEP